MKKLYGRRKGKKLRQRQDSLVSETLPALAIDLTAGAIAPADLFPRPFRELRLEIGFGDGERLIEQATLEPDVAFIGCEPFVNGVAKALVGIADRNLDNVRLHCGDARDLLALLPEACADRLELLYPDPWPKRRHRKRRIVSPEFLSAAARVLKPGAAFRYATDIDDYCGWTLARVLARPEFSWPAESPAEWLTPWDGWVATRYEEKARREGRRSAYLSFFKN